MFGALKRVFKAGAVEVSASYSQNKDFLEAVCAACALVANADGTIEESEKRKALSIITNHSALGKLYKQADIEACCETMFKRAKDASGRQQLARELDDIKGRPDGAQMADDVYLVALDIAQADGTVQDEEKVVLEKIAKRLSVDVTKFDF